MVKKMETTISGLGFGVPWLGFRVIGEQYRDNGKENGNNYLGFRV